MKFAMFVQWAAAVTVAAICQGAAAQSLRCNGDLASVGDSKAAVMQKCGEPMLTDSFCKPAREFRQFDPATGATTVIGVVPCERVDEWTYNPGSGQFLTTFRFENGAAVSIRYGDRVR
jgi:hypothetical protein